MHMQCWETSDGKHVALETFFTKATNKKTLWNAMTKWLEHWSHDWMVIGLSLAHFKALLFHIDPAD